MVLLACGGPQTPQAALRAPAGDGSQVAPPPILLITIEGLRSDAVAGLRDRLPRQSFTPNLDRFIAQASWAGKGVAPTAASAPAVASILTGLSPWRHQVLGSRQPLPRATHTLAEALQERGYATTAYVSGRWLPLARGFKQGFDSFRDYGGGGRTRGHLAGLGHQPEFVWIHFTEPEPPYRLPDSLATQGRKRISRQELEAFRSPSVDLPAGKRREIWRAYLQHVLLLDRRIGGLLAAVDSSDVRERIVVAIVAAHGEEFGEQGQMGHANNLGRAVLEVPMILRLPIGEKDRLSVSAGERPSILRLWATIMESAGGKPSPALPPSLFHEDRGGALSELYLADGRRLFSFVEGGVQLIREVTPGGPRHLPFSGGEQRTTLWGWEGRSVRELRRGDLKTHLEKRLEEEWSRFLDRERAPQEEARTWSAG